MNASRNPPRPGVGSLNREALLWLCFEKGACDAIGRQQHFFFSTLFVCQFHQGLLLRSVLQSPPSCRQPSRIPGSAMPTTSTRPIVKRRQTLIGNHPMCTAATMDETCVVLPLRLPLPGVHHADVKMQLRAWRGHRHWKLWVGRKCSLILYFALTTWHPSPGSSARSRGDWMVS